MTDGGKGSTQRPRSLADKEWADRWDAIFQRDKPEQPKKEDDVSAFNNKVDGKTNDSSQLN